MNTKTGSGNPYHIRLGSGMYVAGLCGHYTAAETAKIPKLWQRFASYLDKVDRLGEAKTAYGVCYNQTEAGIDYMCGIEVSTEGQLPAEFQIIEISPQTYAVFTHTGHISEIHVTWRAIRERVLPEAGLEVLHELFFEKYGPAFDSETDEGGLEIWLPVKP